MPYHFLWSWIYTLYHFLKAYLHPSSAFIPSISKASFELLRNPNLYWILFLFHIFHFLPFFNIAESLIRCQVFKFVDEKDRRVVTATSLRDNWVTNMSAIIFSRRRRYKTKAQEQDIFKYFFFSLWWSVAVRVALQSDGMKPFWKKKWPNVEVCLRQETQQKMFMQKKCISQVI